MGAIFRPVTTLSLSIKSQKHQWNKLEMEGKFDCEKESVSNNRRTFQPGEKGDETNAPSIS